MHRNLVLTLSMIMGLLICHPINAIIKPPGKQIDASQAEQSYILSNLGVLSNMIKKQKPVHSLEPLTIQIDGKYFEKIVTGKIRPKVRHRNKRKIWSRVHTVKKAIFTFIPKGWKSRVLSRPKINIKPKPQPVVRREAERNEQVAIRHKPQPVPVNSNQAKLQKELILLPPANENYAAETTNTAEDKDYLETVKIKQIPRISDTHSATIKDLFYRFSRLHKVRPGSVSILLPYDSVTNSFTIKLPDNLFKAGQYETDQRIHQKLKPIANIIRQYAETIKIMIIGHADNQPLQRLLAIKGAPKNNLSLATTRAREVLQTFLGQRVDTSQMTVVGTTHHLRETRSISLKFQSINQSINQLIN